VDAALVGGVVGGVDAAVVTGVVGAAAGEDEAQPARTSRVVSVI
jgi:hypothetical protein